MSLQASMYEREVPAAQLTPIARALQISFCALIFANGAFAEETTDGKQNPSEALLPTVTVKALTVPSTGLAAEGYRTSNSSIAGFAERSIKDTPFSVTVIPSELMQNHGVGDLGKLSQIDASVSESYGNWYPGPLIRGFDASSTDNYRRNGMAFNHLYTPGLENKERVEILKGLSGLQAGFSSPGGAINYVTKRPEDISDLHVSANQFGNAKAHVDVGRMVTEDFGYRLNVAMEEQRNHIDKVEGPRHFIAGAVSWKITPDTYFDFDVEHERRSKTFQPALTLNADGKIPDMPNPSTFYGQNWAKFGIDATTTSGRLQQKLGQDWSVSIAMMHQDLKRENNWLGFDSITPSGDAVVNLWRNPNEKFSVNSLQLTAQGRLETAGARHDLAFGYEDSHRRTDGRGSTWVGAFGSTNIYNPVALPQPSDTNDAGSLFKQRRSGFFLNDVIALGDMWDIHVGGRYAQVKDKTYDSDILTSTYEKTAFTPTAALVFKPRRDLSAYLSYTEGLETGGTAPIGTTNANEVMAPLVSKQLETGLKGEIGLLAWAASVFRISKPAEYTNSANAYVQTGEQLHQGLELAISGKLTNEVTLFGSTMWLDAKMKETGDPTTAGKRPSGVTKQRVAMSFEYTPTALLGWSFAANWTHSGDRAVNATNTAVAPGYDIFSMGLRHQRKIMGRDVTFRLNVDNVFDKRYWANAKNSYLEVGALRTVWGGASIAF